MAALVRLDPADAANAAELSEGLRGLRTVLTAMAQTEDAVDETTRRDFEAACALLGRLEYDIEGGRRLLRVIAAFGQLPRLRAHDMAPLLELSEMVQRRVVALALIRGRYDHDGQVRAAAFRANHAAHGDAFLHEVLLALITPRSRDDEGNLLVTQLFQLVPELGDQPEPYEVVFDLVREHGLPDAGAGTTSSAIAARMSQLHALMQVTHDFSAFPDHVRALAMATLGDVSGAGFRSLREEEWARWWTGFRETETARLERAEAAERGAGSEPEDGR